MSRSRTIIGLATLALCGVSFALAPAVQGMVQATKQHEKIKMGAGSWAGTLTTHSMGEPMTMPCSEVVTSIGDLWTTSRFEADFMGMPFVGSSVLGYDPEKKKYVGTWIDSMHPRLTVMEGTYDEAKKAIVMEYDMLDDLTGTMKKMRSETVFNAQSYTMKFFVLEGRDAKLDMEINLNRKGTAMEAGAAR